MNIIDLSEIALDTPAANENANLKKVYPVTFYPQTTDSGAAAPIVLSAGKQFIADMQLQELPALRLRVLSHSAGAGIAADLKPLVFNNTPFAEWARNAERESAQNAAFSCLAPGRYDLTININHDAGSRTLHREIVLFASKDIDVAEDLAAVPVSGKVKLSPPGPYPKDLLVCLESSRSEAQICAKVSESGEFDFGTGVLGGSYQVQIKSSGLVLHRLFANGTRVEDEKELEISGDQAVRLALVAGPEAVELHGVVAHADQPASGALVLLVPTGGENEISVSAQDQSDSDGIFTLRDVFPGQYILLAIDHGWDVDWSSPEAVKPYLPHGQAITVQTEMQDLKVKLQPQRP